MPKDDIAEWRQNPVTMQVFRHFRFVIREAADALAAGRTLDHASAEQTLANTAHEVGRIAGIKEVLEFGIETREREDE